MSAEKDANSPYLNDPNSPVFNAGIIEEFRKRGGSVGGFFEGMPMLLLHHRGARSGIDRVNPLVYQSVGDAFAVFATKGGGPVHPGWYFNLKANPDTKVEVGSETVKVRARELHGAEREEVWEREKRLVPGYAPYEEMVRGIRELPVILLERRS